MSHKTSDYCMRPWYEPFEPLDELPEERIITAGEVDSLVVKRSPGHAEFCRFRAESSHQFLTGRASVLRGAFEIIAVGRGRVRHVPPMPYLPVTVRDAQEASG